MSGAIFERTVVSVGKHYNDIIKSVCLVQKVNINIILFNATCSRRDLAEIWVISR
jgi:hypothetical protein